MNGSDEGRTSLFERTYSKEEILNRERYVKVENSEIRANKIDIEQAVNNAVEKMEAQIKAFSKTGK